MEKTEIQCNNCGAPLDRDKLDRRLAVIECTSCGTMLDLIKASSSTVPGVRDWVTGALENQPELLAKKRALVYKPKYFKEFKSRGEVEYRIPNTPLIRLAALGVIALCVLVIVSFFANMVVSEHAPFNRHNPLVPILCIPIAAITFYGGILAHLRIKATKDSLTLCHTPSLFQKTTVISASRIKQLFVSKSLTRNDNILGQIISQAKIQMKEIPLAGSWSLKVVLDDGNVAELISQFPTLEEVLYLEQELELQLGIRDAPVGSETITNNKN